MLHLRKPSRITPGRTSLVRTFRDTINISCFVEIGEVHAECYIIRCDIERIGRAYRHGKCGLVYVYLRCHYACVAIVCVSDNFFALV